MVLKLGMTIEFVRISHSVSVWWLLLRVSPVGSDDCSSYVCCVEHNMMLHCLVGDFYECKDRFCQIMDPSVAY